MQGGSRVRLKNNAKVSPIKRHLSREKNIPTVRGVSSSPSVVGIGVNETNQPIRLPGLKPGVCSGLILSGAFYPDLKIGVWRRRTYQ